MMTWPMPGKPGRRILVVPNRRGIPNRGLLKADHRNLDHLDVGPRDHRRCEDLLIRPAVGGRNGEMHAGGQVRVRIRAIELMRQTGTSFPEMDFVTKDEGDGGEVAKTSGHRSAGMPAEKRIAAVIARWQGLIQRGGAGQVAAVHHTTGLASIVMMTLDHANSLVEGVRVMGSDLRMDAGAAGVNGGLRVASPGTMPVPTSVRPPVVFANGMTILDLLPVAPITVPEASGGRVSSPIVTSDHISDRPRLIDAIPRTSVAEVKDRDMLLVISAPHVTRRTGNGVGTTALIGTSPVEIFRAEISPSVVSQEEVSRASSVRPLVDQDEVLKRCGRLDNSPTLTDPSTVGLISREVVPIETSVEKARKSEDHDIQVASHLLHAGMTTVLTAMGRRNEGPEPKVPTVAVANVLVLLISAPDHATLIAIVMVVVIVETAPIVATPVVLHADRTFEVDPVVIGPTLVTVPLPTVAIDLTDHPKDAAHMTAEDHRRRSVTMTRKSLISRTDLLRE